MELARKDSEQFHFILFLKKAALNFYQLMPYNKINVCHLLMVVDFIKTTFTKYLFKVFLEVDTNHFRV
jgi:hypothetical protein